MKPRTLKTRIFLSSALVAVLAVAFAVQFVTARVAGQAEAELRRGLEEAATQVEQRHLARLETLTLMARMVADLPKLKAAVETNDPPTVQPLASEYKARLKADLLMVTTPEGGVLAALGPNAELLAGSAAVRAALAGEEATSFHAGRNGGLHVATVPITIGATEPELLGTLSVGFAVDDALAAQFKRFTSCEVALAAEGRILASTLAREQDGALSALLDEDGVGSLWVGENEFITARRALGEAAGGSAPVAIVLRSRTERLLFLRTFRTGLLLAGLVAILVAVLLSYAVAGTVTRPLSAIAAAMREMTATGDLTRKIPPGGPWEDEDARVLASSFNTLTDSIARFQREAAVRERLSALGRLSTVIAHEVRNPLMIIKAAARPLRRGGRSPEEIQEAAADIDQEVARLDRIVGDVLDFARPVTVDSAPTDLNALCREAAAAAMAGEGAPSCQLDLDPRVGTVLTDGERLRAALVNILSNAREAVAGEGGRAAAASSSGPRAPDVELTTRLRDGRVAIVVEDRGPGFEASDLTHVFEPYFTTKRTGTGLGLAIAKNIVDSLGGTITAQPASPSGARLQIDLPAARRPAEAG
jgi:signal transduction histidine kinase